MLAVDAQQVWKRMNKRSNPASEGEFLRTEQALGHLAAKRMFHCSLDGVVGHIPADRLFDQQFDGIRFVGAISTLYGQDGLHSQCLWYAQDQFDWFWVEINEVQTIEFRIDSRFRGGSPCLWMVTPVAEYVLATPHVTFIHEWDHVLNFFEAPHCDVWPREGMRPDWWPIQSCGHWPGTQRPGELPNVVSVDEELRQLTAQLTMHPSLKSQPWCRLEPRGGKRFPGQRRHTLKQLLSWDVYFNSGIKVTDEQKQDEESDRPVVQNGRGWKRKRAGRDVRRTRKKGTR
ncbi:hypothetical protein CTheo_8823 [Ceratobasidium theobromae]|uniref:Uncharacterized protein n=1 Tax=Ceratobasidium theobromae TaxID=1582974 RepID=A0A5N5Q8K8_9AGAM|nr:hypothetical protein CTheo_8823 [Ceratobasidium theobromae]